MLLLFGVPLWLVGSRYTLDGWLTALGWLLAWLGIPVTIPDMRWGFFIGGMALLGLGYSYVEIRRRPGPQTDALLWAIWLVVIATDVGSTFFGFRGEQTSEWPLMAWMAETWPVAAVVAAVLTFLPEWFITGGWKHLRG
jgi:hypothetical protein